MRAHLKLDKSGVDRKIQILGSTSVIDSGTLSSFTQTAVKTIVMEIKGWFASLSVIHDVHICKNPTWRSFKPFSLYVSYLSVFSRVVPKPAPDYTLVKHILYFIFVYEHVFIITWFIELNVVQQENQLNMLVIQE